ncbi:MAG: hypothetical protein K8T90_08210 [Planctomycetes bacterium]|nr:hypothetical protein [Planctomycetota bacterium]
MHTLELDLAEEKRRIADLARRARLRLDETAREADALQARGAKAATEGDVKGAGELERRSQKARALQRRYQDLVLELEGSGERLAAEVLLARLQGPEVDLLAGEVERNRDLLLQRATALLKSRDRHRALRQKWAELNEKIRVLRADRGLQAPKQAAVDFRVIVSPQTYSQKPDGPTLRELSDLIHQLGL